MNQLNRKKLARNSGQGLIEYMLLVALMGVAAIGVIRMLNHVVNTKFAQVANGLVGKNQKIDTKEVDESFYKVRDLNNFFEKSGEQGNK